MKSIFSVLIVLFTFITFIYSQEADVVPGEIIVMLKSGQNTNSLENAFKYAGLTPKQQLVPDLNIWLFSFNNAITSPLAVLSQVRRNETVAIAQFNHYVTQRSTTPNDTQFPQQWSLNNTGQTGGTPDADIDAPEAWGITTGGLTSMGDSIVVAIVDGGFYLTHPDLKFWKNYGEIPGNGIDDDGNGYIDDVNGWNAFGNNGTIGTDLHGTHCSGIAGAIGNNNLGVSGVNWGVKIMAVMGSSGTESVVLVAYGYVLKQRRLYNQTNGVKGAFVVSTNSSFGVDYGQPANYPLWCAFYDSLGSAGILNACATANLNIDIDVMGDIPTACPSEFMVSVTNTTNTDAKNSGAAYGHNTIDLGAPGTSILSTTTTGNYGLLTGTSMATPHVAGGIALMISAATPQFIQLYKSFPGQMALIIKSLLLQGVDPKPSMQNVTVSGGRLNVNNSVILMQNITGLENTGGIIPKYYNLYQNYPNPFNPSTVINYDIPKSGFVSLKIYDALGREAATLINSNLEAGIHHTVWNAANFTSGIYFYKLETSDFTATKKMALIK